MVDMKRMGKRNKVKALLIGSSILCCITSAYGIDLPERFKDKEDGALDLSEHLLTHSGFLPMPILITEPALGYGAGLGLLFFDESIAEKGGRSKAKGERFSPPNIAAVGGFKTENGSYGGGAGYFGSTDGDRYRYLGAIATANLNLDYYGTNAKSFRFNLDSPVVMLQGLARIHNSDWFVGARYQYVGTTVSFANAIPTELVSPTLNADIGRLSLIVDYDSRDNLFSPANGTYMELNLAVARPNLGSSRNFNTQELRVFHYLPLLSDVTLGLRADLKLSSGDIPFFAKPYVTLRGVPAMRYQDQNAVVTETEVSYNLNSRWSLIGFGGVGKAYGQRNKLSEAETVTAGGAGFRYLISRKLGLRAGLDVAHSPIGNTVYIQVGSAWR
jgi:hypothetical protein